MSEYRAGPMLEELGPVTNYALPVSKHHGGSKKRRSTSSIDLTEPGFDGHVTQPKRRGRPPSLSSQHVASSGGVYDGSALGGAVEIKRDDEKAPPRLSAQQVTQRVLSRLMCEGALGLEELVRNIPDATKELVGSVLEIMQVLGLVVHYRVTTAGAIVTAPANDANDTATPSLGDAATTAVTTATASNNNAVNNASSTTVHTTTVSSSSSSSKSKSRSTTGAATSNQTVYVLAGFAKGSEPQEIRNIIEHTAQKRQNAAKIQARCAALQALTMTNDGMTCAERVTECRGLVVEVINRDGLHDDVLYRTIAELCGHTFPARRFGYG